MYSMRFSLFFLFFYTATFAQTDYPQDYFSPPLDIPMQLSGNFGELRPNHFHAGFDLKTNQKEGLKVHAVADGYVSRIKISTFGSGKTIYITHPNGYTSVYGHLQKATDSIEHFINKEHYLQQSFEIELFFKPNELTVKKGQIIAYSGNTGSSEGPHLHFEFRDSKTENVINPMLFGFNKYVKDNKNPVISGIYVYPLDDRTTVNQSKNPILLNLSLQKDGTYISEKVVTNGKIGFGVNTFDYDDVSFNKNGVYKVQSFSNGKLIFGYQFDTFSYNEVRYINALIDYSRYKKLQQRVQKLYMKNPYNLSIIKTDQTAGIINVVPNLASVYRIEISDFSGNKNIVSIPIHYDLLSTIIDNELPKSSYFVKYNKDNIFVKDNVTVFFLAGTFYDDFNLNFDVKNDTLFLHEDTVAVHTNFTISIENKKYNESQKEKIFIASIEDGKKVGYNTTYQKDNIFNTKVRTLGKFSLVMDTIKPKINIAKPIENKWLNDQKTLQFTISDDLSGIKSYNGFLNDKWVLFEYDNKTKKIIHTFSDGIVAEGKNTLKLIVLDNVGNSVTFEAHFFRSQKNDKK